MRWLAPRGIYEHLKQFFVQNDPILSYFAKVDPVCYADQVNGMEFRNGPHCAECVCIRFYPCPTYRMTVRPARNLLKLSKGSFSTPTATGSIGEQFTLERAKHQKIFD
jgi:hypothetical protein